MREVRSYSIRLGVRSHGSEAMNEATAHDGEAINDARAEATRLSEARLSEQAGEAAHG
jgi:hypothetical protein